MRDSGSVAEDCPAAPRAHTCYHHSSSWSTVVADLTLTDAACRGSVKCGSTSRLQERAQWVVAAVIWPTLAYNR